MQKPLAPLVNILLALLCGAAAASVSAQAGGQAAASATVQAGAPATASPRSGSGASILPPAVANAIAASGLSPKSFGLYAQQVEGDRTIVAFNPERPFSMASTTKVVTSLAALDLLGPFYRWRTSAFALGTLADGKLVGDLLIVGGGDAQLTSAELKAWFKRIREQGLREIDGNIVLDRYAFQLTAADHANTPGQSASEPRHVLPDAMTLDEGVLGVVIQPSRGARPAVALQKALADVRIDNQATMGSGACEATARWDASRKSGRASVVVQGNWGAECGRRVITFVPPADSGIATRSLPSMWAAAGGVLRGRVVAATAVPGVSPIPTRVDGTPLEPLSFHRSKPLTELVRDINKASDNVGARNLMLSLSPGYPEKPATLAGAQKVVNLWLREQGLASGDIEVENGSGLSHSERAKPRALVQLLRKAWVAEQAQAFFESLPVAGVDGTLKNRLQGGRAKGQAYLKTGTLNDTRALAGYVHALSGKMYAVAVFVNDVEADKGRPALDAIIEWLARNG